MVPFWTWSSAQVTVTFLASLRVPSVTVRLGAETVPSATLLLETGITTFAVGWLLSRTVNVAVPPDSVVTRPATGATVMPATSLSRSEERRVGAERRSQRGARLGAGVSTRLEQRTAA